MRAYERLLNYVKIHTASDPEAETIPSTKRQFDLARVLVEELKELGAQDARVNEKCYVYASLPATKGYENAPALGFIAHMDTAPDFNGEGVNPQIIENYDGEDVAYIHSDRVLSPRNFPHLAGLKGRTLIVTDGTTLLGGDDKAGIAEIMTALEEIEKGGLPHGKVCVAFTPDEEVGKGADYFDVKEFGADFAYTLDGGYEGGISYENFNAASAKVEIKGFNVHPGSAKDTMINALLVAMEFHSMLPAKDNPRDTQGYEGFFHLCSMTGDVESAKMEYIIRDHDSANLKFRKQTMEHIADCLNHQYGEGTVTLIIQDQYQNMLEVIREHMHLATTAEAVIKKLGMEPAVEATRGGTDGSKLSFMGLPCPNLGTGGYAAHGPYEHITAEGMDQCTKVVLGLIDAYKDFRSTDC